MPLSSDDVEEPLTPSHLLVGCSILNLPDHLTYHEDGDEGFKIIDEALQRRAKYLSSVLNHFWERWSKKWTLPEGSTSTSTDIRGGDVVLVHDQDHPRGFWKMARVRKLITGRDGQTCGAVLKLPTNSRRFTTLQRPVQLIYSLGVAESETQEESESVEYTEEPELEQERDEPEPPKRSRDSALRAADRVKTWTSELISVVNRRM